MFSSIFQRMTVFAFTVHAVLGCCWHHAHTASGRCCVSQVSRTIPVETDVAHHHGCSHNHHCGTSLDSETLDSETLACEFSLIDSSPCDDPNQCNGTHCHYVMASSPKPIDHDVYTIGLLIHTPWTKMQYLANRPKHPCISPHGVAGHFSAPSLCADLQSWQI